MKLHQLDRRWVFLFVFVGVALPLIFPFGLPIEVTQNVRLVYELVNSAKPGDTILLSFDYDPGAKPELQPAAKAMMRHAITNNLNIVCIALWPMGVSLADEIYRELSEDLIYGQNFVNLGYVAGGLVAIQSMGRNFRDVFPRDVNGEHIDNIAIMNGIRTLHDFAFIASFSGGVPGLKEWVQTARDNFGVPVTGATTAVSTPGFMPYINEQRQLHGLIGGLKSAAEYEKLIGVPGTATAGMDAQSVAHLIIVIFIILGNISWHFSKKIKKKGA